MTEKYWYYCKNPTAWFDPDYPGTMEALGITIEQCTKVNDEFYQNWCNPPEGYEQVFDSEGPRVQLIPEPDYVAIAESTRESLLNDMRSATYTMSAKMALGRVLTDSEKDSFNAWLDYSDSLQALDLSTAPDIEWPEKPA
ncbi:MAG: tail fiber assembly protein [Pantoea sp.]|uniref:tail fiber assembly protein n=1 Tax=Pantoea sp. TaxID=69393 RepID=UPI0039E5A5D8